VPPRIFSLVARRYDEIQGTKVQMAEIFQSRLGGLIEDPRERGLRLCVGDARADASGNA
jgi:hypothetical protein